MRAEVSLTVHECQTADGGLEGVLLYHKMVIEKEMQE
jgi:hypothetical protein